MSGKRFAILCCLMLASAVGAIVTIVVLEAPPLQATPKLVLVTGEHDSYQQALALGAQAAAQARRRIGNQAAGRRRFACGGRGARGAESHRRLRRRDLPKRERTGAAGGARTCRENESGHVRRRRVAVASHLPCGNRRVLWRATLREYCEGSPSGRRTHRRPGGRRDAWRWRGAARRIS